MKKDPGLIAKWCKEEFGFISVRDPTTGEWHDIPTKEAADWMKRECFKRRELYKAGNRRAYSLTREDMEEIWAQQETEMWTHPAISEKGIFYEDYAEDET